MTRRNLPARGPIRRIAIISKLGQPDGPDLARNLGRWLGQRGVEVFFDAETSSYLGVEGGFSRTDLPEDTDLAIVAGGDGTLLSVARAAAPLGVPILGVNFGGLGFLSELQPDELFAGLERVLAGNYEMEERHAIRVRYLVDGVLRSEHALLNDVVITKAALARMITCHVRVDEDDVATYTADGLIVSTPTGSTAYNLSAGGPILDPRMGAFVVAPICPHTMTYRPLVVPGDVRIEIRLEQTTEQAYLTLDGQVGFPMQTGDTVLVDEYRETVKLVRVTSRGFFDVLRGKLRWGAGNER